MRPFIVIGDQTDHGGVVVGSTQTTDTFGKRLARVGDQVTCPKKGHGTTVIVTGDPTMIVDGAPVARHGDKCACGATLIASQFLSGASEGGGSGASSSRGSSTRSARSDTATSSSTAVAAFDDRLQLIDDDSGTPLARQEYAIKRASGQIEYGTTDDQGHTHLLSSTASAEAVDIYV
ncbi:PAAR domain-containing protein [Aquabacterium sp.]|uniref:PAAR domain-containing protein n=1 Tax=Aquabacterium sp. TaxID=1872578 RepID=UPI0035AE3085